MLWPLASSSSRPPLASPDSALQQVPSQRTLGLLLQGWLHRSQRPLCTSGYARTNLGPHPSVPAAPQQIQLLRTKLHALPVPLSVRGTQAAMPARSSRLDIHQAPRTQGSPLMGVSKCITANMEITHLGPGACPGTRLLTAARPSCQATVPGSIHPLRRPEHGRSLLSTHGKFRVAGDHA